MNKLLALAAGVALAAIASTSQAVLLAHFELNEASGNAADSSGNAYQTLAVVNFSGMSYGQPSVTPGTYGAITVNAAQAAAFGTSIDFGTDLLLNNGHFSLQGAGATAVNALMEPGTNGASVNGAMTVMAWVNLNDAPNINQTIFSSGSRRSGWKLGTLNGELLFTTIRRQDFGVNFGLVAGQWSHLALTAQNGEFKFYLNGNLMATRTAALGYVDDNTGLALLGYGSAGGIEPMLGRMDEVKIFTTALDASAIAAAALPTSPVPEPGTALMSVAGLALLGAWVKRQRGSTPAHFS